MKVVIRVLVSVAVLSTAVLAGSTTPADAGGAVQVAGVGVPAFDGGNGCTELSADYTIALTGDLEGCIYGTVTSFAYHENSGTYSEIADEIFIGSWGDVDGTFEMVEHFTAKFDTETGAQIFGRCQHPITAGSGDGGFEGVTGRLDFKDDVSLGTADYRGHLKLG